MRWGNSYCPLRPVEQTEGEDPGATDVIEGRTLAEVTSVLAAGEDAGAETDSGHPPEQLVITTVEVVIYVFVSPPEMVVAGQVVKVV